jgi:hypothetical protein
MAKSHGKSFFRFLETAGPNNSLKVYYSGVLHISNDVKSNFGLAPSLVAEDMKGRVTGETFLYVTKNKAEDIYNYYRDRVKAHHRKVGSYFLERSWK